MGDFSRDNTLTLMERIFLEPISRLTGHDYKQAKLLASLLIIILSFLAFTTISAPLPFPGGKLIMLAGTAATLAAYFLSRTNWYVMARIIAISTMITIGALFAFLKPGFYGDLVLIIAVFAAVSLWFLMTNRSRHLVDAERIKTLEESVARAEREFNERKQVQESLATQTERAVALEESLRQKDVLLREIHHRVKNNLQIISSLLCLQLQQVKSRGDRGVFLDLKNRVRSIVSVHEMLYESENAARVCFTDYARDLARNIFNVYGVSEKRVLCSVRDSEVSLEAEMAVPIGLIVTELVSNSLKYAFPGERRGTIEIALENPNGDSPVLVIADDGIGIDTNAEADSGKRKRMGLKIVEILAKQIDGEIAVSVGNGTMFSIKIGALPGSRRSRS